MTETSTATIETLTAEVRVLMVGKRQVTLSVTKQLDSVDPWDIRPWGRIRSGDRVGIIGTDDAGNLVTSSFPNAYEYDIKQPEVQAKWREFEQLPLIVLAGLK